MTEGLLWLGFAHAIGDLALQTHFIGMTKHIYPQVMFAHCIIYAGCLSIALKYINRYSLWKFVFLLTGHFIIDTISSYFYWELWCEYGKVNFYDQLAHLAQILMVYFINMKGENGRKD